MKRSEDILELLKKDAEQIEIPEGVKPEQMLRRLERNEEWKEENGQKEKVNPRKKWDWTRKRYKAFAAAACIFLVFGGALAVWQQGYFNTENISDEMHITQQEEVPTDNSAAAEEDISLGDVMEDISGEASVSHVTYEEIYASMLNTWNQQTQWQTRGDAIRYTGIEELADDSTASQYDSVVKTEDASDIVNAQKEAATDQVGSTNVQTVGVDEGDIVKNDGRYLYQIVDTKDEQQSRYAIQIVDTKDELTEVSRITGFSNIVEFYVQEKLLITIENKYYDRFEMVDDSEVNYKSMASADYIWRDNSYHEISIYNIEDRSRPRKMKTFTLQGDYESSRIADGYFYGISRYYANPGNGETDYASYVPRLDGNLIPANHIYLPKENRGTSYLVFVSVDLSRPSVFADTFAMVSNSGIYYVSQDNIYVAQAKPLEEKEGLVNNQTALYRITYEKGKFILKTEGEVPGYLNDNFSMDEYDKHLRVVSTVQEYQMKAVTDDRTGEQFVYEIRSEKQTNALYVLDKDLNITGKIEGLAQDERIYSARFFGTTGYFVTFRQTDPLFAVDLTDPANPTVLSELKVSGFSEYLHFYGENLLLGIGMEADEETGAQKGMKLSMFDITDPSDVKEISRFPLENYNYSEALYNHRAILIHPKANILGFLAEGSNRGKYWSNYLVFSYDEETSAFVKEMELDAKGADGNYYQVRGTFINNVFYLLRRDGSVQSYDRNTGKKLEELSAYSRNH